MPDNNDKQPIDPRRFADFAEVDFGAVPGFADFGAVPGPRDEAVAEAFRNGPGHAEWALRHDAGAAFVMPPGPNTEQSALGLATLPGWTLLRKVDGCWLPYTLTAAQFRQHLPERLRNHLEFDGSGRLIRRSSLPGLQACQIVLGYFEGPGPGLAPGEFHRALIAAFLVGSPSDQHALREVFPGLLIAVSLYRFTSDGRDWIATVCEDFRARQLADFIADPPAAEKAAQASRPHRVTFHGLGRQRPTG